MLEGTAATEVDRCENCRQPLYGEYCAHCGQHHRNLRRSVRELAGEAFAEFFSLEARTFVTLRPLLLTPGQVPRDYLDGKRVVYLSPLKTYLIAALFFFGLFSLFPMRIRTEVVRSGASGTAARTPGSRFTFDLPDHLPIFDGRYQVMAARAQADPDRLAASFYSIVPRTFFVLMPVFALLLEVFYRKQGYFVDHLVASLYYHAFVFLDAALLFLVLRARSWLPAPAAVALLALLAGWLLAYLPLALRRIYGGSWKTTALKLAGLGALYVVSVGLCMPVMVALALLLF